MNSAKILAALGLAIPADLLSDAAVLALRAIREAGYAVDAVEVAGRWMLSIEPSQPGYQSQWTPGAFNAFCRGEHLSSTATPCQCIDCQDSRNAPVTVGALLASAERQMREARG